MKGRHVLRWTLTAVLGVLVLQPDRAMACATCFGQSDSALAEGMNMGILALLGVLAVVLSGVTGFFVFIGRKSARAHANSVSSEAPTSPPQS